MLRSVLIVLSSVSTRMQMPGGKTRALARRSATAQQPVESARLITHPSPRSLQGLASGLHNIDQGELPLVETFNNATTALPRGVEPISFLSEEVAKKKRPKITQVGCSYTALCEKSGKCPVVDIADTPDMMENDYCNAKVDMGKINKIDKEALKKKHLRIRTIYEFLDGCGFYTFPLIVMNQLIVAKRYGLIGDKKPIVYMPENHHYYDCYTSKSNERKGTEFWERWFTPVGDKTWRDVSEDDVWEFSQDSIKTAYYDYRNIHAYPYDAKNDWGTPKWIADMRARAAPIMKEFINVRPELVSESKKFYEKSFGTTPTIGMHMRGTDKFVTGKVKVSEFDVQADRFLKLHEDGSIFLATDDKGYLDHMNKRYKGKVAYRNVMRETGNVLYDDKVSKDKKCKEALLDTLTLSWASSIVKSWSGVSEFAVYFRQARKATPGFETLVDLQLFDGADEHPRNKTGLKIYNEMYKAPLKDIETERTMYLPAKIVGKQAIPEADYLKLQAELDSLTSSSCSKGRTMQPNLCEWGFGSTVNSLVKPVMHALKYGYCLKDPVGWKKYNCSNWQSLFAPISKPSVPAGKTVSLASSSSATTAKDTTGCDKVFTKKITYSDEGQPEFFFEDDYHSCVMRYSYGKEGNEMLPASHQSVGFFGSVSFILNQLFRPSTSLAARIVREKKSMGWPAKGTPVLGIHYRAGDACLEEEVTLGRRCDSFDYYMKQADLFQKRYGIKHIYLATDSAKVVKTLDKYPKWNFMVLKDIGRGGLRNKVPVDDLLNSGRLDGCKEGADSFIDMHLLGESDAFLGKFSSNIDRVAYNFIFARNRGHRPHISLDNSWCFDYGVKSRVDGVRGGAGSNQKYYC